MKRIIIVLIACFIAQSSVEAESKSKVNGSITCDNKELTIVDAAAVCNAEEKRIKVYLFPSKLSSKDMKQIKSGQGWKVGFDKKSPDKRLWESWCPNGRIDISFDKEDKDLISANFCNFIFFGMEKNNHTANINRNGPQVQKSIQKLEIKSKHLTLQTRSEGELMGVKYSWKIILTCPVFELKE